MMKKGKTKIRKRKRKIGRNTEIIDRKNRK